MRFFTRNDASSASSTPHFNILPVIFRLLRRLSGLGIRNTVCVGSQEAPWQLSSVSTRSTSEQLAITQVVYFIHSIIPINNDSIMKAARFYDKFDIRIEDVPVPEPKEGEVLIEVAWGGICVRLARL